MTDRQRNHADNLILLCLEHHTLIDGQSGDYPVARILQMKRDHEAWVDARLSEAATAITFVELEAVARGITAGVPGENQDYTLTPPREKIRRNALSAKVERLITLGMVNSPQVGRYVQAVSAVDEQFADRLTTGFTSLYSRLRQEGLRNDDLFLALHDFASQGSIAFDRQAAGLSVLTYLFEKCFVFER